MARRALVLVALVVCIGVAVPAHVGIAQTPSGPTAAPPGARVRRDVAEDRYAMAGGCYGVWSVRAARFVGPAAPFYFRATDLGSYLLLDSGGAFLAGTEQTVSSAPQPSSAADWLIDALGEGSFSLRLSAPARTLLAGADGALSLAAGDDVSDGARFTFRRGTGCAAFPEVEVGVTGPYPAAPRLPRRCGATSTPTTT